MYFKIVNFAFKVIVIMFCGAFRLFSAQNNSESLAEFSSNLSALINNIKIKPLKPIIIPSLSLRSDYFHKMMGFDEEELIKLYKLYISNNKDPKYNEFFLSKKLIEKKTIDGKPQFIVHSLDGNEYQAGFFTTPTIITLEEQAAKLAKPGNGRFNIVIGTATGMNSPHRKTVDVGSLQANPDNRDAVFQVASNFSALEPTGPHHYPESGITNYIYDYTQGPFASISAAPGLFYRMYGIFYDSAEKPIEWRQTQGHQIELLGGDGKYSQLKKIFPITNGYVDYVTYPESVNLELTNKDKDEIRIGYHRDIQITYGFTMGDKQYDIDSKEQTVNQVFTAAIDFGSLNIGYKNHPKVIERAQALLDAAYAGTLLVAATNKKKKVFLTLIGGGVFGNDISWISSAIAKNKEFIKDSGLDITLIIYNYSSLKSNNTKSLNSFKNSMTDLVSYTNGTVVIDGQIKDLSAIKKL